MTRTSSLFTRIGAVVAVCVIPVTGVAQADPESHIAATGTQIVVSNEFGSATCTLGPLVTHDGVQAFLTSAHCAVADKQTQVFIGGTQVGLITHAGSDDEAVTDFALVAVDPAYINDRIVGKIDPTNIVGPERLTTRSSLCKIGGTTGATCGKYVGMWDDGAIVTTVPADHGDSGSAVFVMNDSSSAGVVGMISRGNGDYAVVTPIRNALTGTNTKLSVYARR